MNEKAEELRAARAAIEDRRAKAAAEKAESEELARETKALADAEALEKAELDHGADSVATIDTPEGLIIVKRPVQATYRKFVDSGKTDSATLDALAAPCVVHPEKLEYRRLLDKYPHTVILCANAVCKLAGLRNQEKG